MLPGLDGFQTCDRLVPGGVGPAVVLTSTYDPSTFRDRIVASRARGFLPKRFREAGLIARTDDRGDAVMQIAPPLIADAALLDEIVDRLGDVLTDAGKQIGVAQPALA